MTVPEAAMDENANAKLGKDEIGAPGELAGIQRISESLRVQETAHKHLGPGILAPNTRHHARARGLVYDVNQLEIPFDKVQKRTATKNVAADPIPVVDLFAGPGGLGEGFSSLGSPTSPTFRIQVSAEMDAAAHKTLQLRAYYRALLRTGDHGLVKLYYDFCHGLRSSPYDSRTEHLLREAQAEALQLTLGDAESNKRLDRVLGQLDLDKRPWVLIGGPPCQAYSLVGRSRNQGKKDYSAEDDHRHFLYKEYLRIIQRYRPAVFVMENVKGLLSSKVGDQRVFHQMLLDLADPDAAVGTSRRHGTTYRIHSLSSSEWFDNSRAPDHIDASAFVVRSEEFGIPQARHRVILLGVRADLGTPKLLTPSKRISVESALRRLPKLRSRISRLEDDSTAWLELLRDNARELATAARTHRHRKLAVELRRISKAKWQGVADQDRPLVRNGRERKGLGRALSDHFKDHRLRVWLNHEPRGHMKADLRRYLYAAAFAKVNKSSPKGHEDFSLPGLAPAHRNWKSGKFADRFRVQVWDKPSTTITSHISKDGHYYIHPEPTQCRSLTVREAARLQTFPDNYLFCGNRTQQYHQVGNAVPPYLAKQIAEIVAELVKSTNPSRRR